jgi:hypothetical protein
MAVGIGLIALNLIAGIWGITAWLTRKPSVWFWHLLRGAQIFVVLQTILGVSLLLSDHKASSDLHYLYGLLPLPIMLITEMMRIGAAQKVVGDIEYEKLPEEDARALAMQIFIAETRVMALGCLIIAALAFRAATTAGAL